MNTNLIETLTDLVPSDVAVAGGTIDDGQSALFPVEMAYILGAALRRQQEFRAGRTYARRALEVFGLENQQIGRADDRSPIWPNSIVGSITHSSQICAAVVARSQAYWGIGIDLEPSKPLAVELYSAIGRPEEQSSFYRPVVAHDRELDRGKLVFSAKEAVFKAIYPSLRQWFDFQDVLVEIDVSSARFTASFISTVQAPKDSVFEGRWSFIEDHFVTALIVHRRQPAG